MKYNIGEILKTTEDIQAEGIFGSKKNIKSNTKLYIGADDFIHMLDGTISSIENNEVEGYSVKGIADFIYEQISNRLPIDDMLVDYDIEIKDFKENIEDALEELGMYDNTGNRS